MDYEIELIKLKNNPSKHKPWLKAQIGRMNHKLAHHCNLSNFRNWLKRSYLKDERDYFVNLYQIACNLEQQEKKATCSCQPDIKTEGHDFCTIHGMKFSDQNHDLQQKEDIIGLQVRHDLIDEMVDYTHQNDPHNVYEDREISIIQTLVEDLAEVPVSMELAADDLDLLDTNLVCIDDFGIQKGTAYQRQINKEDHIILHSTAIRGKKIPDDNHPVKQVDKKIVKLLKYATDYNKIGLTRRASSITDLCWILSDGADKLLNNELTDFDDDSFKQFLEHIDSFGELHTNNIPIATEFFAIDPNITPQQQQLKTKYAYKVEKMRSYIEDGCVTLANKFFDQVGFFSTRDQLGIFGDDFIHLFGAYLDLDNSLSDYHNIHDEYIQTMDIGISDACDTVRFWDKTINLIRDKIDTQIVGAIYKSNGYVSEGDFNSGYIALNKALENIEVQKNLAKIANKIQWEKNIATAFTEAGANLAKMGVRYFCPLTLLADVPDILQAAYSALDSLGIGELLVAADMYDSDNFWTDPAKGDEFLEIARQKQKETFDSLMYHVKTNPSGSTKFVLARCIEWGVLHNVKKNLKNTSLKEIRDKGKAVVEALKEPQPGYIDLKKRPSIKPASGVSKIASREIILPKVKTFEQARNKALEIVGDLGPNSEPIIGKLKTSAGFGKVVGRRSANKRLLWRIDYDPVKGPHINVVDISCGKRINAKKYVIPFEGTEETFKVLIKRNT